ncbi:MAG: type transport system ATP-binding protein [Candidatus Methanomethylophilaceae archaeon]|nr:type transport system ATP-binding protein [Candidatus Methanomethylophilaceae archaeon]MDI3541985.1 type transport system ATP-binding protein [Candidatus Methanomethylophilaceae archaeon]HIJ00363.1 ABC transporter ATP-binding protein [Candidatus Methanomethylophilaceae archaeon]
MDDPIVLEGLTKSFGDFKALDSVDLRVRKNSFTGFLGPNGAGKSTTLKILTNLIKATAGSAYINGIDVTKDSKNALANVGVVVETPEFYPYLTPREIFGYIGELHGMTHEEIDAESEDILELLKMTEWSDKRIGQFSKGMKQRIAIGQALLTDPEIVILDEPTSGLDPRGMVEIREILESLRSSGLTIFMSSHMLYEVSELCDRVAIIEKGKIIADGSVDELLRTNGIRRVEVQTLNEISNSILETIGSWKEVNMVQRSSPHSMEINLSGGEKEQAELLSKLIALGLGVFEMTSSGSNLESLYMELVKESR